MKSVKAKKKIPVFPVPRPTLKIRGRLNFFFQKKNLIFRITNLLENWQKMDKSE